MLFTAARFALQPDVRQRAYERLPTLTGRGKTGADSELVVALPGLHFFLGTLLGIAVAFLDAPGQLVTLAVDLGQIVVGQVAPFLLDLALGLIPLAFHLVPVHL